jgi:hypothetical protein
MTLLGGWLVSGRQILRCVHAQTMIMGPSAIIRIIIIVFTGRRHTKFQINWDGL